MMLFAKEGCSFGDTAASSLPFVDKPERKGSHGHDSSLPDLHATFIMWGAREPGSSWARFPIPTSHRPLPNCLDWICRIQWKTIGESFGGIVFSSHDTPQLLSKPWRNFADGAFLTVRAADTEPVKIDPGPVGGPPSDAIVLFDGKDLSQWLDDKNGPARWEVKDGMATVNHTGYIHTKQPFADCQLHVEWATPEKIEGEGQGRGNSGVFLQGRYEVQVLDSYTNQTYFNGQAGAVYSQYPPLVNACRKPGEWQVYDIIYHAPRLLADDGTLKTPARCHRVAQRRFGAGTT